MKIWKNLFIFYLGGMLYCGLELLWRGRTHGSMFLLGGSCFLILGRVGELRLNLFSRAVLGGLLITAAELVVGLLVNQQYRVWDYRSMPLNILGQVCPAYTLLWTFLSPIAFVVYRKLEQHLPKR